MAPKGNKTLRPDNLILVDFKKSHNDDKQELSQIEHNRLRQVWNDLMDKRTEVIKKGKK